MVPTPGPDLGPGAYYPDDDGYTDEDIDPLDPDAAARRDPGGLNRRLTKFSSHRRAPAAGFHLQASRADAVGPFGQRPEAAVDADREAGIADGDVLELPSRIPRPDERASVAFTFARAGKDGEDSDGVGGDGGDVLVLDADAADVWRRRSVAGGVSFAKQLGRQEAKDDGDGDVLELELNREYVEPRAPAASFSRQQGRLRIIAPAVTCVLTSRAHRNRPLPPRPQVTRTS